MTIAFNRSGSFVVRRHADARAFLCATFVACFAARFFVAISNDLDELRVCRERVVSSEEAQRLVDRLR